MGECGKNEMQSVVFIDLDGFKDVNDNYGHDTGDALIAHIARELRDRVPAGAMLARMGGDEFAMTMSGEHAVNQASAFATAVLELLKNSRCAQRPEKYISAPVLVLPAGCRRSVPVLSCFAVRIWPCTTRRKAVREERPGMMTPLTKRVSTSCTLKNGIREGLEKGEFDVWYQPIVNAETLVMEGVEALLRWPRRPEGPLAPDAFIPIAESSGLIYALGQFALSQACYDLQTMGDLLLSVNISPAQFRDPEFETRVIQTTGRCQFPARRLQLEGNRKLRTGKTRSALAWLSRT